MHTEKDINGSERSGTKKLRPGKASAVLRRKSAAAAASIRILLADGRSEQRAAVRALFQNKPEIKVVGEVADGDGAITQTLDLLPDILLLELSIQRLPALDAMRAIMSGWPDVRILLLTKAINSQNIVEALQIGAHGMVVDEGIARNLHAAIHAVFDGEYWLGHQQVPSLVDALHSLVRQAAMPGHSGYSLTRRETEVIRCIAEGYSNRDIAREFDLSEETVKRHLSNIFDKVGVSTRLELALFALTHNLVTP